MHEMRLTRHGELEPVTRKRGSNVTLAEYLEANGRWEGECFVWTKSANLKGYGQGWWDGRLQYVTHLRWQLEHGPLEKGQMILHRCDNPPCYRLEHLFPGTNQDNMDDMKAKGRYPQLTRDNMPHAKLSVEQAREVIRRRQAEGISQQKLADEYGCHQTTISDILKKAHLYISPTN
jgi:hypothetical protein